MGYNRVIQNPELFLKATGRNVKFRESDLHRYNYFVGCYNSEACRVNNIRLSDFEEPHSFYWLYYTLLRFPCFNLRGIGCFFVVFARLICIFLVFFEFIIAIVLSQNTTASILFNIFSGIFMLLGIPACFKRLEAHL